MKTIIIPIVALIYTAFQLFDVKIDVPQEEVVNAFTVIALFIGFLINHFKHKEKKE